VPDDAADPSDAEGTETAPRVMNPGSWQAWEEAVERGTRAPPVDDSRYDSVEEEEEDV
jgi:hypothetical protein